MKSTSLNWDQARLMTSTKADASVFLYLHVLSKYGPVLTSRKAISNHVRTTERNITRVLQRMEDQGLIAYRVTRKDGVSVLDLTLTNKAAEEVIRIHKKVRMSLQKPQNVTSESTPSLYTSLLKKDTLRCSDQEIAGYPLANKKVYGKNAEVKQENFEEKDSTPMGYSVADVIAGAVIKPGKSPTTLVSVWRDGMLSNGHLEYVPPMTMKAMGQLKLFAQACPKNRAVEILGFCLANWGEFVQEVITEAGLHTAPSTPETGFVLKYIAFAVKLCDEAGVPPEEEKTPQYTPPTKTTLPVKKIISLLVEKPITAAEVFAILGDDDA